MELLLIFTILFSPKAAAGEVERFNRRANGYEEHVIKQRYADREREKAAEKFQGYREKRQQRLVRARESFVRKPFARSEELEQRHLEILSQREQAMAKKQAAYARQRREEFNYIDPRAAKLGLKEYDLESGNK